MFQLAHKICNNLIKPFFDLMGIYFTYNLRPLHATADYQTPSRFNGRVALVLQGPIEGWKNFTLNTVLLYRKWWPELIIILSTWNDEEPGVLQKIEDAGVIVVLSSKPLFPGIKNINYQIATSYAGVLKAKSLHAEYVIKSRTDQRFCSSSAVQFLIDSLIRFPYTGNLNQIARIGCLSLNTFKKRIYGISDMTIFGHIDDVLKYWSCQFDLRILNAQSLPSQSNATAYAKAKICEVYLATNFLESLGIELNWTEKDSFRVLRDHFLVIDSHKVDLIWIKYSRCEDRWRSYGPKKYFEEITYADWIDMLQDSSFDGV